MAKTSLTRTQVIRNIAFGKARAAVKSTVREMRLEDEKTRPRRSYAVIHAQAENEGMKVRRDKLGRVYVQNRDEKGRVLGARKILIP